MPIPLYEVGDQTAAILTDFHAQFEKMTAWMVEKAGSEVNAMQNLFFSMAGETPSSNPAAKNSLTIDPHGKVYLPANKMLESVFDMFEMPNIADAVEDALRCVCLERTCSATPKGCDLGKDIRDASMLIGELFPQLRSGTENLDPKKFLP